MIREEKSFSGAVKACGDRLGYVHVNENDRGIPGTGLVPFAEFFRALVQVGYEAVSYTHLDVYKRQSLYPWEKVRAQVSAQEPPVGHLLPI